MIYQYFWLLMVSLAVIAAFVRKKSIPFFILLFAIFPASAVLVIGSGNSSIGISPYYAYAIFLTLILILNLYRIKKLFYAQTWLLMIVFVVFVIIGVIVLPYLFYGIGVYTPRLGIDSQVSYQTPLVQSASQIGQVVYLILNLVVVISLCSVVNSIIHIIKIVFYVALAVSIWQLVSKLTDLPFPTELIANNIAYSYVSDQYLYGFPRINGGFLEASTASAYFSSMTAFFIGYYFKSGKGSIEIVLSLLATLLTTSTTGIVVITVLATSFCLFLIYKLLKQQSINISSIFYIVAIITIVTFLVNASNILQLVTLGKANSMSYVNRSASNDYSIILVLKTWGLGVGLGSNRPSSFLAYVFSNLGIFLSLMLIAIVARVSFSTRNKLMLWPFLAYLFAKVIAIPDLNDNWLWIFFALILKETAYIKEERRTVSSSYNKTPA